MGKPDYSLAQGYAMNRLESELKAELTYHNLFHTLDEVLPAVDWLSRRLGVDQEDLLLVRTAALYHDLGFILQPTDHEPIGVGIAVTVLEGFGYSRPQIETIASLILATRLPQKPKTLLEAILADADLAVLGQPGFRKRNLDLRAEMTAIGKATSLEGWLESQIIFLQTHRYFTKPARERWEAPKQKNIIRLTRHLHSLKTRSDPE